MMITDWHTWIIPVAVVVGMNAIYWGIAWAWGVRKRINEAEREKREFMREYSGGRRHDG